MHMMPTILTRRGVDPSLPRVASFIALARIVATAALLVLLQLLFGTAAMAATTKPIKIVLIGGESRGNLPAQHAWADGIVQIERLINSSPEFAGRNVIVKAFPGGFPADLTALEDADTVLLYFSAIPHHPLADAARRKVFADLMARGVGLVSLHQSFTVPASSSDIPFAEWLGATRIGMVDRTSELTRVEIPGASHAVGSGLKPFMLFDEFYPTITFSDHAKITPILSAHIHVQSQGTAGNVFVFQEPATSKVIAWAAERANGGRSVAFTGTHYLAVFDIPEIRTLLLNSILWTARQEVPRTGATSTIAALFPPLVEGTGPLPIPQREATLRTAAQAQRETQPWGELQWFASRALGNSTTMTVGRAIIRPGQANPVHRHPNCDEILQVRSGHIMHKIGDREVEMQAGDIVTIPQGMAHNARNIGTEDAVLDISFSSADRVAIGE